MARKKSHWRDYLTEDEALVVEHYDELCIARSALPKKGAEDGN